MSAPDSVLLMSKLGLEPDPWQIDVLQHTHPYLLLNCCRQAGKSTVVAFLGLYQALTRPDTRVLLVSRSLRQSRELFRNVVHFHRLLGGPGLERCTAEEMEFKNMSRIVCLPCKEETIRGYAHIDVLIMDEAARVPDDVYRAVSPMLAVSQGRLICLSTPYGRRGFFYDAWAKGGDDWARIEVPAEKVPRISAEFLARERRAMGEATFRQEFCCSFEALEGLVYPDFARCLAADLPADYRFMLDGFPLEAKKPEQIRWASAADVEREKLSATIQRVGGIDFGFRNPFAAVWGFVDRDGILWLVGEHYARQKPLSYHVAHLPRNVMYYADPSGAGEISELRAADLRVRAGENAVRLGITAVTARVESGTLRILEGRCPNLLAEAGLYRYGADEDSEVPVDDHNHALAALRYMIMRLDKHRLGRNVLSAPAEPAAKPSRSCAYDDDNDPHWIPLSRPWP